MALTFTHKSDVFISCSMVNFNNEILIQILFSLTGQETREYVPNKGTSEEGVLRIISMSEFDNAVDCGEERNIGFEKEVV